MITLKLAGEAPQGLDLEPVRKVITALNQTLEPPDGSINWRLVDDPAIAALNEQYSGNAYPTDVLSFSYIERGGAPIAGDLGDVAVSLETAQRQSAAAGIELATEVALLVLHACLHILNYDHGGQAQQERFGHLQADLMEAAGL